MTWAAQLPKDESTQVPSDNAVPGIDHEFLNDDLVQFARTLNIMASEVDKAASIVQGIAKVHQEQVFTHARARMEKAKSDFAAKKRFFQEFMARPRCHGNDDDTQIESDHDSDEEESKDLAEEQGPKRKKTL